MPLPHHEGLAFNVRQNPHLPLQVVSADRFWLLVGDHPADLVHGFYTVFNRDCSLQFFRQFSGSKLFEVVSVCHFDDVAAKARVHLSLALRKHIDYLLGVTLFEEHHGHYVAPIRLNIVVEE